MGLIKVVKFLPSDMYAVPAYSDATYECHTWSPVQDIREDSLYPEEVLSYLLCAARRYNSLVYNSEDFEIVTLLML